MTLPRCILLCLGYTDTYQQHQLWAGAARLGVAQADRADAETAYDEQSENIEVGRCRRHWSADSGEGPFKANKREFPKGKARSQNRGREILRFRDGGLTTRCGHLPRATTQPDVL